MHRYVTIDTKDSGGKVRLWSSIFPPILNPSTGVWERNKYDMGTTYQTTRVPVYIKKWVCATTPYGNGVEITLDRI